MKFSRLAFAIAGATAALGIALPLSLGSAPATHFGPDNPPVSGGYDCTGPTEASMKPIKFAANSQHPKGQVSGSVFMKCPYAAKQVVVTAQIYKKVSAALWELKGSSSNSFFNPCAGCTQGLYGQYTCKATTSSQWATYAAIIVFRKDRSIGSLTQWSTIATLACA